MVPPDASARAARHAALGDPTRLTIVDLLALSSHSPSELQQVLEVPSNLLAHHLDVLEDPGEIASWGVMTTPALVVDDEVVVSGRVPTAAEVSDVLARR